MKTLEIKNLIVNWLKDYAENNQIKVLVVGVSGGIDSALTSALCAMTGIKTIVLFMPIHQTKKETDNAENHINWLSKLYKNTEFEIINLTRMFEEFKKTIPVKFQSNLSLANTRARLRMTTLYQICLLYTSPSPRAS